MYSLIVLLSVYFILKLFRGYYIVFVSYVYHKQVLKFIAGIHLQNFFGMLLLLPKLYLCSGLRSAILSTLRECAQIDWALSCTRKMQIDKSLQDNWSSGQSVHTEF